MSSRTLSRSLALLALGTAFAATSLAQSSAIPALNSRANAPYTLYLNFGGFSYPGQWGGGTPGVTPAFNTEGSSASFSATELNQIRETWARTAEKFTPFGINVTTVDPAVAAGQTGSDTARRNYYDLTPRVVHTVIGGSGGWSGGVGVSYVDTAQYGNSFPGGHTNWTFSAAYGNFLKGIAETIAHEDGHALNLDHQSSSSNEYSDNGGAVGNGSYAPIMGNSDNAQRGLWRANASQNDVANLMALSGIGGYVNAGIGRSLATATPLPLTGSAVNAGLAKGIITPTSATAPNPLGVANYTQDYFAFSTLGGTVTLTSNDGSSFLQAGVADPGATMDSELEILDALGNVVGLGIASTDTLRDSFTGTLATGNYYARISSIGGYNSTTAGDAARYYTMGSYFLTGSGFAPVPEPATLAALGLGALAMLRRRKRA